MSEKWLLSLARKSLIALTQGMLLNPCDFCLIDKQYKVSFQKSSNRKPNVLDLVYSIVCNPIEEEFLGDNKYILTLMMILQ